MYRSRDGGRTWTSLDLPERDDFSVAASPVDGAVKDGHTIAWHPAVPGWAYEAGGGGAAWSRDGGTTWERAAAGLDLWYAWALTIDPADPECWYVSASPGPGHAHGTGPAGARIYHWRGGGPWEPVGEGVESPLRSMPYALVSLGDDLVAGLSDGRILHSPDRGDHWSELVLTKEPLRRVYAMAIV